MFGPFKRPKNQPKKRYSAPEETKEQKERAVEKNKEAADRLDRALERLKPMQNLSDFLGGNA